MRDMPIVSFFASALAGLCGAMGFGSGTVLLLYLTLVLAVDQQTAQGINLLFFLPCGLFALAVYLVRDALPLRRASGLLLFALPGAALGWLLLSVLPLSLLRRVFGGFLLVLALREFLSLKSAKRKQLTGQ